MKQVLAAGFVALLFALAPIASGADQSKIFPYAMNRVTLDNGLTVVSVPFESPGIIAYYTVVRTGSRNEIEPGKSGFAHFFEHMMFRGTTKYPKSKFNELLKSIGADNNASTSDDQTVYHTVASAAALETIVDMESDRFMNLKYSEEDFRTEAGSILGEYNKSSSNPFQTIDEKMRDAAFTVHTYKHTTIGFIKDIEDMPNQYQYSLTFFDRWYRPENCTVVVVGDFKQDELLALVRKYYGGWKRGSYKLDVPQEPPQTAPRGLAVAWKAKTLPILAIGYHGPAFSDTDPGYAALDILSQVVFSETSDLYRELVDEKQIVESVEGSNDDRRDPFLFTIDARIKDAKNMQLVEDAIIAALEKVKTTPVSAERLASIKSHMKYQYAMGLDNPGRIAASLCHYIELTGDPESVNRIYALYEKVSPEDIMAAAKKYFTDNNRTTLVLTHEEVKQ